MPPDDELEAQGAAAVHPHDNGLPLPVRPPHQVLFDAYDKQRVVLTALVGLLERTGLLTREALTLAQAEVRAQEAVDATVGLIADLVAQGRIAPWPASELAESEARYPCGCAPAPAPAEEVAS